MSHLVLFDALNLAHRGYAVQFGMLGTIAQNVLRFTERATHAAFIFDSKHGREKRKEVIEAFNRLYARLENPMAGYKAKRPARHPDFLDQLRQVGDLVKALGVRTIHSGNGEADDAIATLAHQAAERGWRITVITNDKDIYPILRHADSNIYNGRQMVNEEDIKREYGFRAYQWTDYAALRGKNDQFPGVPGIGDAISRILINKYTDIPTLYRNLDDVRYDSEIIYGRLTAYMELAVVSRQLATLDLAVTGIPGLDSLRVKPRRRSEVAGVLQEYELYRVLLRL